ncbi:hypothetical protein CES85_4266 [Ochrobactrum quorumnocens]|uniref:Uncharacterized protein n=1 Tax=Ochrobactrum quorumnocens TaxID=271865 RepID=A0A248U9Y9_9HYPH|nr:hypothetical protein CES85_4266 [[Ochrobactrum] quorumnocens]
MLLIFSAAMMPPGDLFNAFVKCDPNNEKKSSEMQFAKTIY